MLNSDDKRDSQAGLAEGQLAGSAQPHSQPPIHLLERRLSISWPEDHWRDTHILIAASGGADSVALLRACLAIKSRAGGGGRIFVGHLNHGLRGPEADADAKWLETMCRRLGVAFESATVDVTSLAADCGDGIEAVARHARYNFLRQTAERLGGRYVVTGHTADDQVETVLHRVVRGTGLAGLAGIPSSRALSPSVTVIRPMLTIWRREIIEYLHALGQDFRNDVSNDELSYTRNRVRRKLLPAIREQFNPNVDDAITQLAFQAGEAQQCIQSTVASFLDEYATIDYSTSSQSRLGCRITVDCARLSNLPPLIVREILKTAWSAANWPQKSMGFTEWCLLADLAAANCNESVTNLPSDIRARREANLLYLTFPGLA